MVRERGLQPATAAMVAPGAVALTPGLPGTIVMPDDEVAIVKPPADKKLYRRLRLLNGMLVLLISDPAITKQSSIHSHGGQPQSMSEEDSGDDDNSEDSDEVAAELRQALCLCQANKHCCLLRAGTREFKKLAVQRC